MENKSRLIFILVLLLFLTSCISEKQNETLDLVVYVEENKISIMEMSGRKIENVTYGNEYYTYKLPKWDPGGNRIAFLRYNSANSAQLVIVDYSIEGNHNVFTLVKNKRNN